MTDLLLSVGLGNLCVSAALALALWHPPLLAAPGFQLSLAALAGPSAPAAPIHVPGDWPTIQAAIDAGTAYFEWAGRVVVNLSPTDYVGAAPDMGAFETGGSGAVPATWPAFPPLHSQP